MDCFFFDYAQKLYLEPGTAPGKRCRHCGKTIFPWDMEFNGARKDRDGLICGECFEILGRVRKSSYETE